ncbi:MAG: methyltransferase domain-containing protein [Candidatus Liptonbacteria bacterium]|nr:methyltransferase domain-containing protein [Candidatus Liptonbacteria bacterium]
MKIKLDPVIDFGKMPIANAFLTPLEFKNEFFYNMVLGYDPATHAIGLVNTVPPEKMFHDHYAFFSSTSKGMQKHFRDTAEKLLPYAGKGLVVEIGSNDGIMLEAWKEFGVRALGVEPSANVAAVSKSRGHDVISKFMSRAVVDEILSRGKVSLVFGANVSCHIENFQEYLECITHLIGRDGVFVFEDPYFMDIVEKTSYDQVYDEHVWYFTISFINKILEPSGFHVFDCEHIEVHGGELRMYVGHKDTHPAKPVVAEWLAKEAGLEGKLELLKGNIVKSKTMLLEILNRLKKEGKRVAGFGATSKATTIFNYCGIGPDLIPFVTDNTPAKQGKLYPGVHIPVVPQDVFEAGKTDRSKFIDYAFLGAWNHFKEIDKYQFWFKQAGGRWMTHVPMPHIVE